MLGPQGGPWPFALGLLLSSGGDSLSTFPSSLYPRVNAYFRGLHVLKRGGLHMGWDIWEVQEGFMC